MEARLEINITLHGKVAEDAFRVLSQDYLPELVKTMLQTEFDRMSKLFGEKIITVDSVSVVR